MDNLSTLAAASGESQPSAISSAMKTAMINTPSGGVIGATFIFGISLSDWASIFAIGFIAIQAYFFLKDRWNKHKGNKTSKGK